MTCGYSPDGWSCRSDGVLVRHIDLRLRAERDGRRDVFRSGGPRPGNLPQFEEGDSSTISMQHVRLHVAEGIVLDVPSLRAEMISRTSGPPVFDDGRSYVMQVSSASVSMDLASLQTLLNHYALGYEGAPLTNVRVSNADGRLEMKGTLHKGVAVPFSAKAAISATPDGHLRLHVESMKAVGIPAKGLLGLFGLELDDLVKLKQSRGIDVQENDIVIDPGEILPPPEIRGKIAKVAFEGDRLVQTFDSGKVAARLQPPDPGARNYIYFGGGDIRFGKLTM